MINRKDKIIFIHIPRTAGTSMSYSLRKFSSDFVYPNNNKHFDYREYKHYLSTTFSEDINNYFVFTIIRSPWDRIISHWKWHTSGAIDNKYCNNDNGIIVRSRGRKLKNVTSFKDYILNVRQFYTILEIKTQYDYLKDEDGELHIDFIIRYEIISEGLDYLRNKKKMHLNLLHIHETDHEHYSKYFKNNTTYIDIVTDIFGQDIRYFKYPYKNEKL